MYESDGAFSSRSNYVVNGAVYIISSWNYFVNRALSYVTNQRQLQWAAYVVPRVTSTYRRSYFSVGLLTTMVHTESNMHTTIILFYSCLAD